MHLNNIFIHIYSFIVKYKNIKFVTAKFKNIEISSDKYTFLLKRYFADQVVNGQCT